MADEQISQTSTLLREIEIHTEEITIEAGTIEVDLTAIEDKMDTASVDNKSGVYKSQIAGPELGNPSVTTKDEGSGVRSLDVSVASSVGLTAVVQVKNSGGTLIDPATEGTLSSIDTKVATETTLALIKNTDGIKKITDPVDVSDDDSRLLGRTKVLDSAGSVIDPATEGTLSSLESKDFATETTLGLIKDTDGIKKITDPIDISDDSTRVLGVVGVTNSSDVRIDPATEGTLSSLEGKDFATETTLALIKNTDGIKKITDPVDISDEDGRLLGRVKVLNSSGTVIDPATEGTLGDVKTAVESIDTNVGLIKDTDGIKKIVDPVDVGSIARTKCSPSQNVVSIVTPGTAVPLNATTRLVKHLWVQAKPTNGSDVTLGGTGITPGGAGINLQPGEAFTFSCGPADVIDMAEHFINASATESVNVVWWM